MKRVIFLVSVFSLLVSFNIHSQSSDVTSLILVRHSEKSDIGDDPELSEKGIERAGMLASMFKDVTFDAIYSTNFQRTRQTVDPIAKQRNIRVRLYEPSELEAFAELIASRHVGETVLIVGHSNTTPTLVNVFGSETQFENLSEDEYDSIFFVDFQELGKANVRKLSVPLN